MAWITPFVNWLAKLAPLPSDFNRIEGNIQYLKDRGDADRTLTLYGDVNGSTTYDDNGGISIGTTVVDNSHNHISANISDATNENSGNAIIKRDSSGSFNASGASFSGDVYVGGNLIGNATSSSLCTGDSLTAYTLKTSRLITINGGMASGSVYFNGGSDVSLSLTVNYANACYGNSATATLANNSSKLLGVNPSAPPIGTKGAVTISGGSVWIIPAGVYSMIASGGSLQIVNENLDWVGVYPPSGMVISNGTHTRIHNAGSSNIVVIYYKIW